MLCGRLELSCNEIGLFHVVIASTRMFEILFEI